jgi:putative ABC transport system ATP-binding protein
VTEPISRFSTVETIGRGVEAAPVLRSGFGLTLGLAMVGAAGRVALPILVQQAIDRGFSTDGDGVNVDVRTVWVLGALALVATTIATFAQRAAVRRLGVRSEEALYGLRVRLFEHIHRLSIADHNEERKGALVARVTSDVETLAMFFSWGALAWLLDGTLMLIVATVMVAYDWVLALVAFVVAAPLGFVLRRVQHHLLRAYERARVDNAEVLTTVSEVVSGAETLRVYGAGPRYAESTKRASARRSKSFVRAGTIGAFLFPSGEVFSVLTVAAVVAVGVVRGPASGLTAGAMVGFVFLTYRFLEPIAEFTEVIDQTQTAVAGLRRVLGVLDLPIGPPEPRHPQALPSGALGIDIEHVTFTYPSRCDGPYPRRPAGGDGGRDRLGQDHPRTTGGPPRRPLGRCGAGGWGAAHPGGERRVAPPPRGGAPGAVPVRGHHRLEPRLRPARPVVRRGGTGRLRARPGRLVGRPA